MKPFSELANLVKILDFLREIKIWNKLCEI